MLNVSNSNRSYQLNNLLYQTFFEHGQSNEEGRGSVGSAGGQASVPGVYVLPNYDSQTLELPMSCAPFVGPRIQKCRDLISIYGKNCAVGRFAHGGSFIDEWLPGQPFNIQAKNGALQLKKLLEATLSPRQPLFKFFSEWCHGESDAQSLGFANLYASKFRTVLDDFDLFYLSNFGLHITTIIIGINQGFLACPFRAIVEAAQITVAAEKPWRIFLSTAPILGPFDADLHYNTAQQLQLGSMLAPIVNSA